MNDRSSMSARIWKYRLHYVIVLPALLLLFLFKGIPFLIGIYLPFVDFNVFKGIFGSPWTGMGNFRTLFQLPEFRQVLTNTIALNLGYVVVSGAAGLLAALAMAAIRWERLRTVFSTLFLLPYFVPSVAFAYAFAVMMSPDRSPLFAWDAFFLGDAGRFRLAAIAAETLKTVGIPALIALTAIASRHEAASGAGFPRGGYLRDTVIPAARAVFAFALLRMTMPLTSDFDLMNSLVNPLVFQTGDTLATFGFRVGFVQAQYSLASAAWLFQFAMQLLFACAAYALLRGAFANDLFGRFERPRIRAGSAAANGIGLAASLAFGIAALLPLYVLFVVPLTTRSEAAVSARDLLSVPNALAYGLLFLAATVVHMLMTVTLAFPLTAKRLPGRQLYKLLLIFVALIGSGTIHEYLFFRNLGLVDTRFAAPLAGIVSVVPAFVLKSVFNAKYGRLKEQAEEEGKGELHAFATLFLPNVWKPWIALGVLQLVALASAYQPSLLYVANPGAFPPVVQFMNLSMGMSPEQVPPGDPLLLALGAIISLPGVALLLLFRPWLTSEVLVSQVRRG
ncbi:hypothetical protein [Paenibacillus sp.]|uniref:hypothetical protein n=1 Tax=Paenibacillus sp. TaxID=58172 RepID=UPI0028118C79|nr:hypothetical protein [Paenibacillus sp.]